MKASIILLNYNGKQFNIPCIDSILQQNYQDFEIIFVDNVSTDGSLEEVKKRYQKEIQSKKMIIVENNKNTWFAWGNNLWITYADKKSEYICLLNNDTTVPENRLLELVKGIQSDIKLWAVGSIILDKGYEEKIKEKILIKKTVTVSSLFGESVRKDIPENEYKKWIFYTSVLSGCSLLYRKNIIETPFPERYFAYAEDIFFSRLLIIKWYKMAMIWSSLVYHFWSGSFGKNPSESKLFYGNRNQICNFLIFYDFWTKVRLFPLFFIVQIWHISINAPFRRLKAKIKARIWIRKHRQYINMIKKYIKKHKKISQSEFSKKLSYKFNDEIFFTKQKKMANIHHQNYEQNF